MLWKHSGSEPDKLVSPDDTFTLCRMWNIHKDEPKFVIRWHHENKVVRLRICKAFTEAESLCEDWDRERQAFGSSNVPPAPNIRAKMGKDPHGRADWANADPKDILSHD